MKKPNYLKDRLILTTYASFFMGRPDLDGFFTGTLEECATNILGLEKTIKEQLALYNEKFPKYAFLYPEDIISISLSVQTNYDSSDELEIILSYYESEKDFNKRLEIEKRAKREREEKEKRKKTAKEKREKTLYERLKKKFEGS